MTRAEIAQYIKSELANDDTEIYLDIDDYKIIVEALEQEQKLGKWLPDLKWYGYGKDDYHCSICGRGIHLCRPIEQLIDYPYCHCGAKMESEVRNEHRNSR